MPEEKAAACPKIAVIAVHGVADQAPYETARSVASLLLKRNVDATKLSYDPFSETQIQIPNHPVYINDFSRHERINKSGTSRWQRLKNYFTSKLDERSPYILELHNKERAVEQSLSGHDPQSDKETDSEKSEEKQKPDPPDYGFMHGQLRSDKCGYQWDHNAMSPDESLAWSSPLSNLVAITQDKKGLRQEFCIRPGAHTHYLDETAPEISAAIDHLIKQATSNLKRAPKGGD